MHTKLHIDLSQGIIDIEGDSEFVREIYSDLRESIVQKAEVEDLTRDEETKKEPKSPKRQTPRRSSSRKKAVQEATKTVADPHHPQLDKTLDTSNLAAFYGQYSTVNHPEKILVFAKFIIDELKMEAATTDHIFTCYMALKERVPQAFAQSFRNAHGKRHGFIDYRSDGTLHISMKGENHLNHEMNKKDAK